MRIANIRKKQCRNRTKYAQHRVLNLQILRFFRYKIHISTPSTSRNAKKTEKRQKLILWNRSPLFHCLRFCRYHHHNEQRKRINWNEPNGMYYLRINKLNDHLNWKQYYTHDEKGRVHQILFHKKPPNPKSRLQQQRIDFTIWKCICQDCNIR